MNGVHTTTSTGGGSGIRGRVARLSTPAQLALAAAAGACLLVPLAGSLSGRAAADACAIRTADSTGSVVTVFHASCGDVQQMDPTRFGDPENTVVAGPPGSPAFCHGSVGALSFDLYPERGGAAAEACAALADQGVAQP